MNLVAVKCDRCNAPLRIPVDVNYATCGYCHTRLKIDTSDDEAESRIVSQVQSAAYRVDRGARHMMAAARRLEEHTKVLHARNQVLRLRRRLVRVKEDWNAERRPFLQGFSSREPSVFVECLNLVKVAVPATAVVAGGLRLFEAHQLIFLMIIGLVVLLLLTHTAWRVNQALDYGRAKRQFRQRLDGVANRLADAEEALWSLTHGRREY